MKALTGAVLLLLAGCGSGPCADPVGTYVIDLKVKTGNCGDAQFVQQIPQAPGAGCTGKFNPSADNCSRSGSTTCASPDGSSTTTFSGKVDWNQDGSHGSGVAELSITGASACQGTYDINYQRQ